MAEGGEGGEVGGLAPVNRWCTNGNRTKCGSHKDSVETEGRHLSLIVNNKSCKKVTSQYESCIELQVACDYLNQLECDALI